MKSYTFQQHFSSLYTLLNSDIYRKLIIKQEIPAGSCHLQFIPTIDDTLLCSFNLNYSASKFSLYAASKGISSIFCESQYKKNGYLTYGSISYGGKCEKNKVGISPKSNIYFSAGHKFSYLTSMLGFGFLLDDTYISTLSLFNKSFNSILQARFSQNDTSIKFSAQKDQKWFAAAGFSTQYLSFSTLKVGIVLPHPVFTGFLFYDFSKEKGNIGGVLSKYQAFKVFFSAHSSLKKNHFESTLGFVLNDNSECRLKIDTSKTMYLQIKLIPKEWATIYLNSTASLPGFKPSINFGWALELTLPK